MNGASKFGCASTGEEARVDLMLSKALCWSVPHEKFASPQSAVRGATVAKISLQKRRNKLIVPKKLQSSVVVQGTPPFFYCFELVRADCMAVLEN